LEPLLSEPPWIDPEQLASSEAHAKSNARWVSGCVKGQALSRARQGFEAVISTIPAARTRLATSTQR